MTNDELQASFRLYYDNIFNLCYKCLGHFENAEDAALSAFMEVCNRMDYLDFNKVEGFLIVVAKGKVVDFQRRQKTWRKIVDRLPVDCDCITPDDIDYNKKHASVLKAIDTLPPKMKQVLKLTYIDGYNRNEVAKITETSPNTVRNTLVTALTKLKQLICEE